SHGLHTERPMVEPGVHQQRIFMPFMENLKGSDDEILSFAQFELATGKNDETIFKIVLVIGVWIEDGLVDSLEDRTGVFYPMLAEDIWTPRRASYNDIKKLPGSLDVVCCKERVFEEGIPKGACATHPGCHRHEALIRQRLEHRMRQPCLSAVEDITQRP